MIRRTKNPATAATVNGAGSGYQSGLRPVAFYLPTALAAIREAR